MKATEDLGVEIVSGPTVRESDGLAMSSRNVFLSPAERGRAAALSRALVAGGRAPTAGAAEREMRAVLGEAGISPDYAVVRDAETLRAVRATASRRPMRALLAARVGAVRLIDNAPWPNPGPRG
jgi:pantoate--beta-alanine ligase